MAEFSEVSVENVKNIGKHEQPLICTEILQEDTEKHTEETERRHRRKTKQKEKQQKEK